MYQKRVTFCNFWNRSSHRNDCFWFLELFSMIYQANYVRSSIIITPPGHLFGDWGNPGDTRKNFVRGACKLRWRSLYDNIVQGQFLYRHWHLFFCDFFHLRSNRCPERIFLGEPILPPNTHFVYHIVLFYLRYQPSLKKARGIVLPRHHLTSSWCSDWSRNIFCAPRYFELLRVKLIEITVISGCLQLQMC